MQTTIHACDVNEVIQRSEASLEEEMFQQRDFMLRVNALAGEDVFYLAAVVLALA